MQRPAHPEQHGSRRHLGRNDFIGTRLATRRPQMAAGNDLRSAVRRSEIGNRPHAGEDHSRARHFEKLIRILLAMEHLLPRTGPNLQRRRRMHLVMQTVGFQNCVARRQHQRMRHEGAKRLRPRHQRREPLGLAGIEAVGRVLVIDESIRIDRLEMRRKLAQNGIAHAAIDHAGDDDRAVALEARNDLCRRIIGSYHRDRRHRQILRRFQRSSRNCPRPTIFIIN